MLLRSRFLRMLAFSVANQPDKKTLELGAIWSDTFFLEISKSGLNDEKTPLIDYLKFMNLPQQKLDFLKERSYSEEQISKGKETLLQSMDPLKGIEIKQEITKSQVRISSALNKNKLMSFYPNLFVTSQIFQLIATERYWKSKVMTIGRPGTSKTMAYIFACSLTSAITNYRCKHREVFQELVNKGIIRKQTPKMFYMSFKNDMSPLQVAQLLRAQCTELEKEIDAKFPLQGIQKMDKDKYAEFLNAIKWVYNQKGVECLMVVDQLNTIASKYRQFNSTKIKRFNERKNSVAKSQADRQQQENAYAKQWKIISQLEDIFEGMNAANFQRIYNSSANIESQILGEPPKKEPKLYTLGLNYHSKLQVINCNPLLAVPSYAKRKQLYRHIWYEYSKRFNLKADDETRKVEKIFIEACDKVAESESSYSSFITPYSINEVFTGQSSSNSARVKFNVPSQLLTTSIEIQPFINNICQTISKNGLEYLITKAKKFIDDQNPQEKKKKIYIHLTCYDFLKRNQGISVPFSCFFGNKDISILQIQKYCDKDIFYVLNDTLTLSILKSEYSQFIQHIINDIFKKNQRKEYLLPFLNRNATVRGFLLEDAIISLISKFPESLLKVQDQTFRVTKFTHFTNFNGKNNTNLASGFKSLFSVLNSMVTSEDQYCFASPLTSDQNHSINSPSFDLIAAKKIREDTCEITSFDFTVNMASDKINNKIKKAQELIWLLITGYKKNKVKPFKIAAWTHIIVCKPKHFSKCSQISLVSDKVHGTTTKTIFKFKDIGKVQPILAEDQDSYQAFEVMGMYKTVKQSIGQLDDEMDDE